MHKFTTKVKNVYYSIMLKIQFDCNNSKTLVQNWKKMQNFCGFILSLIRSSKQANVVA